jgi:hypothetical protein
MKEHTNKQARREREKEMFVCLQLAMMLDHGRVVENRFFVNDLLKCCHNSNSHGSFVI